MAFCSKIYDFIQDMNIDSSVRLDIIAQYVDDDYSVLEVGARTGLISTEIANKVERVVCTDKSEKMLKVARKRGRKIPNISFEICDVYDMQFEDNSFDLVIASQLLQVVDDSKKAIDELIRVSSYRIVLPIYLLENVRGLAKLQLVIWKKLGFKEKYRFNNSKYTEFLEEHGLKVIESIVIIGTIPMMIAMCEK